jgi:excisionase family DNA binding protein
MPLEPDAYLTVVEAAERLRTSPQTIYRWCRAGRLGALKIGKEWRIPAGQLGRRREPAGPLPIDALLAGLVNESEHLLGFADDRSTLARLEAAFFEAAVKRGARLVYGRWEEPEAEVRRRLRPVISGAQGRPSSLHVVNFLKPYEEQGPQSAVQPLLREVERARADGLPCWFFDRCHSYFGYQLDRLTQYESAAHDRLLRQPALILCGYALTETPERPIPLLTALMGCHTGAVWFDGRHAVLQRPAGPAR